MTNYVAYTLIDITNTNETKIARNKLHFFQQQNLNTLIQTIGLRSQPLDVEVLPLMAQDVVNFGFGKQYHGLHTVWKLQFSIEHGGAIQNMDQLLAYKQFMFPQMIFQILELRLFLLILMHLLCFLEI